jgi:hypothetical protein
MIVDGHPLFACWIETHPLASREGLHKPSN